MIKESGMGVSMTNKDIYRKRITFLIVMSLAPILAVAPFLIGIIGGTLTGCTQYDCPWNVLPWLSFLTAPIALVGFIVALVLFLVALGTKLNKTIEATNEEHRLKGYYFAWMATALGPLLLAIVLLLAIFGGPVAECALNNVCTETGQGLFVGTVLRVAPVLLILSWLYLLAIWIWNMLKRDEKTK